MLKKNVYKGKRYIPKHCGVWDIKKEYESLSVVLWRGNSYTSKKDVPKNTNIDNEDYWVLSGIFNEQLELYRSDVKKFDNRIKNVESVKHEVEKARGNFFDLNSRLNFINNITENESPNTFTQGTSFLCVNDINVDKYLLENDETINIYKKCGIEEVLLTVTFEYANGKHSCNTSLDRISQASLKIQNNGIKVGLKIQDKGYESVTHENKNNWFNSKLLLMKSYLSVINNPSSINLGNEIPKLTSDDFYTEDFEIMYKSIKEIYPKITISFHSFFSEFYNGTFKPYKALDVVGINYYPYSSDNPVPTYEEVKKAIFKPINGVVFFDTLEKIYKKYNKPFIISEYGTAGFEYQCMNPSTDFIPNESKVLNNEVQAIFMDSACQVFPFIDNCKGLYLWSSNCYRPNNTPNERAWAWDLNPLTIQYISNSWRKNNNEI